MWWKRSNTSIAVHMPMRCRSRTKWPHQYYSSVVLSFPRKPLCRWSEDVRREHRDLKAPSGFYCKGRQDLRVRRIMIECSNGNGSVVAGVFVGQAITLSRTEGHRFSKAVKIQGARPRTEEPQYFY